MGVLGDIRSGKRDAFRAGGHAILFWVLAGALLGAAVGAYAGGGFENGAFTGAIVGAVPGLGIGFYAALGASTLARALAIPGGLLARLG